MGVWPLSDTCSFSIPRAPRIARRYMEPVEVGRAADSGPSLEAWPAPPSPACSHMPPSQLPGPLPTGIQHLLKALDPVMPSCHAGPVPWALGAALPAPWMAASLLCEGASALPFSESITAPGKGHQGVPDPPSHTGGGGDHTPSASRLADGPAPRPGRPLRKKARVPIAAEDGSGSLGTERYEEECP